MRAFSKTIRYAILSSLFFAASVSVAALSFYYVDEEGKHLESQMETLSKNRQLKEHYQGLQTMVDASQAEFAALRGFFLTESETIGFLSDIERLGSDLRVQLSTDALEVNPLPNQKYQAVVLKLRVTGEHDRVVTFIEALETLPYYSYLESIRFEKNSRAEGEWLAAISLLVGLHK